MTGENLRTYLNSLDESYASIARKLGISPQSLDGYLKSQDVKTGLIERISKVYNVPISFFYDDAANVKQPSSPQTVHHDGQDVGQLQELVSQLKERIKDKDELIQLLRKP